MGKFTGEMTETDDYVRRVVDTELDDLLPALPAIALQGPKAVGKTATALRRVRRVVRLDVPGQRVVAEADPEVLLREGLPVLLDEWQYVPAVWDAVRRAVDGQLPAGSILLTGSAMPRQLPTHSGAGRIVNVRMRPLALAERGGELGRPTVSLAHLLTGERPAVAGTTDVSLRDYAHEVVQSGFPGLRGLRGRALRAQLDGYLTHVVERDAPEYGGREWRTSALRNWMSVYAAATGTITSLEKLRDGASLATVGAPEGISKPTATAYYEALQRLWIVDPLPGWAPTRNALRRLSQAPRHHMADPALAARLLGVDERALLEGRASPLHDATTWARKTPRLGALLGQLFESLVTLSVRVYAQHAEARVGHLRLHGGAREIDLIVERADHRVVALEVKLSAAVDDDDVRHLVWLKEQLGDDLLDAIVVTTGPTAYRRPDGIAVVPAALLGP